MFNNKKPSIFIIALLIVCGMCSLSGCGYNNDIKTPVQGATISKDESTDTSLDMKIAVAVTQDKYDSKEPKRTIVYADEMPKTLYIRDENNNQVMSLEIVPYGTAENKTLGHAEFSSLRKSGLYRVYANLDDTDALAEFSIEDNFYRKQIKQLVIESFQDADDYSVYVIGESFELFPEAFGDDWELTESNNGIPDVLDLIDSYIQNHGDDANCYFLSLAAKYSFLIEQYDSKKADDVKKLVENVLETNKNSISELTDTVVMNSETFRLMKNQNERQHTEDSLNGSLEKSENSMGDLWGYLVYLNSSTDVDIELAGKLMKALIKDSDKILNTYKAEYPFFYSNSEKTAAILEDMSRLSVINQILPAYEYYKVIDRQTDFIRGLNSENMTVDLNETKNKAYLVLVFSHLATIEDSVDELYAQEN